MSFDAAESLARRMARPQRHRLLQGYPAVPLMSYATPLDGPQQSRWLDGSLHGPDAEEPPLIEIDRSRKLIVGVIPHTMCKPKRPGCGFCTFGQSRYHRGRFKFAMRRLPQLIDDALTRQGHDFTGRRVEALYFGGGTANLTPIDDLELAFSRLASRLDLRDAELTLEGVPSLFLSRFSAALRWLGRVEVRRPRLSMGVQTFDPAQLRRMGREHFGDAKLVARVVRDARKREIGTSGDFLFNLPDQTRAQMLADIERAVSIGFDQICIYHLVLYEGLGTAWSRDPELLAALPGIDESLDNWLALREALLAAGYVQTTLTNFERADIAATPERFIYEELSFTPDEVDGLGIGPLSLSTFVDYERRRAVKLFDGNGMPPLYFGYEPVDLELLWLTRSLPRMRWTASKYRAQFGSELAEDHRDAVEAIVAAGLLERSDDGYALSPEGMFFADSIAGLIAQRRVAELPIREAITGLSSMDHMAEFHMG